MILNSHAAALREAAKRTDRTGRPHYAVPYQGAWWVTDRNPEEKKDETRTVDYETTAVIATMLAARALSGGRWG